MDGGVTSKEEKEKVPYRILCKTFDYFFNQIKRYASVVIGRTEKSPTN